MGRIIKGQVLTSTGLDTDGESFTREEIRLLFQRMSKTSSPLVSRHDMSTAPIARSFNKQLVELPNGELAITMDLEIFDEEEFSKFGGFSIGLVRNVYPVGSGRTLAAVTLNTRQFNVAEAAEQLAEALSDRYAIQVVERVEKAAELVAAIVVIAGFAAVKTIEGFLSGVGADLYDAVKTKLRRRDVPDAPIQVHFHLHIHEEQKLPVIVLTAPETLTSAILKTVSAEPLRAAIESAGGEDSIQRIVGSIDSNDKIKVGCIVDAQGRPISANGGA
jgi:hypothetical protein